MENTNYSEFGWKYAGQPFYHKYIGKHIEKMLPQDGTPILDVGCGNGYFANYLNEKGYCVYGIDASAEGIEIANRTRGEAKERRFFVNDVTTNQLPEELQHIPFKTIISMEVIEHLYDPVAYVHFIRQILEQSNGGHFIVSTPYHGYLKNILVALSGKVDYHLGPLWVGGHIKFWSCQTLSKLLYQANFRNLEFIGTGRIPYLWRHMIYRAELCL